MDFSYNERTEVIRAPPNIVAEFSPHGIALHIASTSANFYLFVEHIVLGLSAMFVFRFDFDYEAGHKLYVPYHILALYSQKVFWQW